MTTRTTTRIVTFTRPFTLDEIDRELPAGDYTVEIEEETLDNVSFVAYRRISTHFFVPPERAASGASEMWQIHADGLASALSRDKPRAPA